MPRFLRGRCAACAAVAVLASCATAPPSGRADLLDFLADGRTTRDEVYLRLGPPMQTFEGSRIASWRFGKDDAGYFLVSPAPGNWRGMRYELVVVFGASGIAEQHSLVEIRAP